MEDVVAVWGSGCEQTCSVVQYSGRRREAADLWRSEWEADAASVGR